MLLVSRSEIVRKLKLQEIKNFNGHNHLVKDALKGEGDQAMAFLVKKGEITFTEEEVRGELNLMVENDLLTIEQWEQMLSLLDNASNGLERVTNFLRRKRRIKIKSVS